MPAPKRTPTPTPRPIATARHRRALAGGLAGRDELDQCRLGGDPIRRIVAASEQYRDLLRREALDEALEQWRRRIRSGPAIKRRVEIRDQDVVGLDRLEPAGDELTPIGAEHDRGGGEAHRAVGRRGLALELGGRADGASGRGPCTLSAWVTSGASSRG